MFDWGNYLIIANEFLGISSGVPNAEAYYRCGVSRAYYSAYNKAVNFINSKSISITPNPGEGSHQAVIRILVGLCQSAGSDLSKLKFHRVRSDYYCQTKIDENTLRTSLQLATSIDGQL